MTSKTETLSSRRAGHTSADGVPVVFLSGMLADQRMWHSTLDACGRLGFPEKHLIRPVFCDLVEQDTVAEMARVVLAKAPERFALAGMSMGGYVAFEILRQAPERVCHLLLANTRARADSANVRRRRLLLSRIVGRKQPFVAINDDMLDDMLHPDNRHDVALVTLIHDMGNAGGAKVFVHQNNAVATRPDSMEILTDITVPCSVLAGSHDQVISPQSQREMADSIPGATFAEVAGAGHYVPLEQPHVFARSLAELLMR